MFRQAYYFVRVAGLVAAALLFVATPSSATLLVYEPFDYTTGNIAGKSGSTEIGFDVASSWSENSTKNTSIDAGSLSFGSFPTVGNRFRYQVGSGTDNARASRGLNVSKTTGNLWVSFLLDNISLSVLLKGGVYVSNSGDTTRDFGAFTAPFGTANNGSNVQIAYNTTSVQGGTNPSGTNMWIQKFTDLGSASGGTQTLWIIDAADYDTIVPGGVTEAELDANNVLKVSQTLAGAASELNLTDVLRLYLLDNGSGNTHYVLDEIRIATTVNEALAGPTPEPSSYLLGLIALAGLGFVAWRRRAHRGS